MKQKVNVTYSIETTRDGTRFFPIAWFDGGGRDCLGVFDTRGEAEDAIAATKKKFGDK
jgi:hypothetical protein